MILRYCHPAYPTEIRPMMLWTLYIHNMFKTVSAQKAYYLVRLWRHMERKTEAKNGNTFKLTE